MNVRALIAAARLHINPWRARREAQHHANRLMIGNLTLAAEKAKLARANLLLSARVAELEQTIVAMGAQAVQGAARGLDAAWGDVTAAGLDADGRPQ